MKRTALVTGGAGGIGAAIVRRLAEEGRHAIALDVSEERIGAFCKSTGLPGYVCDVTDFDQVATIFSGIEGSVAPIDILVNCAGITRDVMLHKMDPISQWRPVIETNLTATFNTVRCVAKGMRERRWGRIVNVSSMNGERGQMGQANYAAAKAGMIGLTKSIALEMASCGVTANCVAPGFIATEMTKAMRADIFAQEAAKIPVGRIGDPDDIANAIAFLASERTGFITGHVLSVNGGQYM